MTAVCFVFDAAKSGGKGQGVMKESGEYSPHNQLTQDYASTCCHDNAAWGLHIVHYRFVVTGVNQQQGLVVSLVELALHV